MRGARFKGEILPIGRCDSNIQALLSNYSDKTEALEEGQVMYLPAENTNAALFIENLKGELFVTQIEILPTVKMSQEYSSEFSIMYDYGKIFLDLYRNYQNGTLNE